MTRTLATVPPHVFLPLDMLKESSAIPARDLQVDPAKSAPRVPFQHTKLAGEPHTKGNQIAAFKNQIWRSRCPLPPEPQQKQKQHKPQKASILINETRNTSKHAHEQLRLRLIRLMNRTSHKYFLICSHYCNACTKPRPVFTNWLTRFTNHTTWTTLRAQHRRVHKKTLSSASSLRDWNYHLPDCYKKNRTHHQKVTPELTQSPTTEVTACNKPMNTALYYVYKHTGVWIRQILKVVRYPLLHTRNWNQSGK